MITIKNISDVLPSIEERKDFIVVKKDGYTIIDYVYQENDSWDDPIRLECRGLKFNSETGDIIARPFNKFFNVGEKKQANEIDWSRPHVVMDKLDGSMIHPAIVNGEVRFMTRMGITEHSIKAERHLNADLRTTLYKDFELGLTPIFEWTGPENRICLSYEEDKLTLLAIRNKFDGYYYDRDFLIRAAGDYNVPLVERYPDSVNEHWISDVRKETAGIEGYVIWFPDTDEFYKIKTDEYVRTHRALSFFEREDKVLAAVLAGDTDDLYPALNEADAERLREYETDILHELVDIYENITNYCKRIWFFSRKDQAQNIMKDVEKRLTNCYFARLDGKNTLDAIKKTVLKYPDLLETRW